MKTKKITKAAKLALNKAGYEDTLVGTQRKISERQFENTAQEFIHIMQNGGGTKNIHLQSIIRDLEWFYIKSAAFKMAESELNIEVVE